MPSEGARTRVHSVSDSLMEANFIYDSSVSSVFVEKSITRQETNSHSIAGSKLTVNVSVTFLLIFPSKVDFITPLLLGQVTRIVYELAFA